jgi:cell division protein FtsA
VSARIDEWIGFVEDQLRLVDWPKGPAAGVVMTGGGALLKGMVPFLQDRWGWPVRIGVPQGLQGLSDLSRSPGYSTVVGVARGLLGPGMDKQGVDWRSRLALFMARILR